MASEELAGTFPPPGARSRVVCDDGTSMRDERLIAHKPKHLSLCGATVISRSASSPVVDALPNVTGIRARVASDSFTGTA